MSFASAELKPRFFGASPAFPSALILIPAMAMLAAASVSGLSTYLGDQAITGITVSVIMIVIAVVLALVAKHLFVRKPSFISAIRRFNARRKS